jgi:hypothetical protein
VEKLAPIDDERFDAGLVGGVGREPDAARE